jgi:hypothetical protein
LEEGEMKVKATITATRTWEMEYPDNDFSDEVLESDFWCFHFNPDELTKDAKLEIMRSP